MLGYQGADIDFLKTLQTSQVPVLHVHWKVPESWQLSCIATHHCGTELRSTMQFRSRQLTHDRSGIPQMSQPQLFPVA